MSIRNRAAAAACGLALVACALAPAAALAAETNTGNTGSTEVTVTAERDPATGADQLAFEVPTKIAFAAKADGTLVGPSAEATRIRNLSVFGIHVTDIAVSAADGWTLADDAASSAADNSISFTLNGVRAAASADVSADAAWDMAYAGSADPSDSVAVATAGKVSRVTKDLSTEQRAATVTWTLAAGSAK